MQPSREITRVYRLAFGTTALYTDPAEPLDSPVPFSGPIDSPLHLISDAEAAEYACITLNGSQSHPHSPPMAKLKRCEWTDTSVWRRRKPQIDLYLEEKETFGAQTMLNASTLLQSRDGRQRHYLRQVLFSGNPCSFTA